MQSSGISNSLCLDHLTPRQKRLVTLRIENPTLSNTEIMLRAGYTKNSALSHGGEPLKSPKVRSAIKAILVETMTEYDQNPREWVKRSLMRHATGESDAHPGEQIRAIELIGKMTGEFTERTVIDIGEETVRAMAKRVLTQLAVPVFNE